MSKVDRAIGWQGATDEVPVRRDHAEEGILRILVKQSGEKCRAGNRIGATYIRELGQGKKELARILDRVLLIAGGKSDQPQCLCLGIGSGQAAQLNVRVDGQPYDGDNGQQDQQQ